MNKLRLLAVLMTLLSGAEADAQWEIRRAWAYGMQQQELLPEFLQDRSIIAVAIYTDEYAKPPYIEPFAITPAPSDSLARMIRFTRAADSTIVTDSLLLVTSHSGGLSGYRRTWHTTTYIHDRRDSLLLQNTQEYVRTRRYNARGNPVEDVTLYRDGTGSPIPRLGTRTLLTYDADGRKEEEMVYQGDGYAQTRITYAYDKRERLARTTGYDMAHGPEQRSNDILTYDSTADGKVIRIIHHNDVSSTLRIDSITYDDAGRRTGWLEFTGGSPLKNFKRFDTSGHLIELKSLYPNAPKLPSGEDSYIYNETHRYEAGRLVESVWHENDIPFRTIIQRDRDGRRVQERTYRQEDLLYTRSYAYERMGAER